MKAIILVGGEGTRLRPLTYTTVKAMVPVLNKPFIEYMLRHLYDHGVTEIILAMGYKPDAIKNYFDNNRVLETKLIYSIEQIPLGTAGAVKNTEGYIDSTFFVFNGDIFYDIDLTDMLKFHKAKKAMATIALTPVDDPTQFGVVETDAQKRVRRFVEKPKREDVTSNNINAGVYILEKEVFEYMPKNERCMFEHNVFPRLLNDGKPIFGYATDSYWIDMGTPQKYMQLNRDLLGGKSTQVKLSNKDTNVERDVIVSKEAHITPPVVIDKGCTIGKVARLIGPVILGCGCVIGEDATIDGSILWKNVHINKGASVKDCILADNITIENGNNLEGQVLGSSTDK